MLPKRNRADTKDIEAVFRKGSLLASPSLNFKFISSGSPYPPRISFIVPKALEKKVASRNLMRRRGYAILRKYQKILPSGLIGAFIFRKSGLRHSSLEKDIESIVSNLR